MTDQTHCREFTAAEVEVEAAYIGQFHSEQAARTRDMLEAYARILRNTRAQASAPEGGEKLQGKDAVRAMASFIQTGTVVANGDIGSVTMYLDKSLVGKTVFLYDHAYSYEKMPCNGCGYLACPDCFARHAEEQGYTHSNAKAGEVVVTRDESGEIVAVTRQDEEGQILSVIATRLSNQHKVMKRGIADVVSQAKSGEVEWREMDSAPENKVIMGAWFGAPEYTEVSPVIYCTERGKWMNPDDMRDDEFTKPDMWQPYPTPPPHRDLSTQRGDGSESDK